MVLVAHINLSYLSEPTARSRTGGHFFMSTDKTIPMNDGTVITISQFFNKVVMLPAAETKPRALFINYKQAILVCHTLKIMELKQPPTSVQTNNTKALGVINNSIISKHLKPMDMELHWICCHIAQRHFHHHWQTGPTNIRRAT